MIYSAFGKETFIHVWPAKCSRENFIAVNAIQRCNFFVKCADFTVKDDNAILQQRTS